jgi:hypothetical protein
MCLSHEIMNHALEQIGWWAWDALDLADIGYVEETREQITHQLADALTQAANEAAISWSVGWRG